MQNVDQQSGNFRNVMLEGSLPIEVPERSTLIRAALVDVEIAFPQLFDREVCSTKWSKRMIA